LFSRQRRGYYESLVSKPIALPPDHEEENNEGSTELLTNREKVYFDDACFLCHLRARQWNLDKSLDMARETLRWRREAKPYAISAKEIENHFKSGKNYHNGCTKDLRPVIVMRTRLDVPGDDVGKIKTILYQMERSLYLIEKRKADLGIVQEGLQKLPLLQTPPDDQVAWIFDCQKFGRKDVNWPLCKELARVLDHYPEKLGVVYLVETHALFRCFWKIARNFIDEKTRRKVEFVTGKTERPRFFKHFDADQLEKCFGGNNQYKYDHAKYMQALLEEEAFRAENNPFIVRTPKGEDSQDDKKKKKKKKNADQSE